MSRTTLSIALDSGDAIDAHSWESHINGRPFAAVRIGDEHRISAVDPEVFEQLAAAALSAANELRDLADAQRAGVDEQLRIERETRRDHDHCDTAGCTNPVSGGIAGNGIEVQWCTDHEPDPVEAGSLMWGQA